MNDVQRMRISLVQRFGFGSDQILQLVDTDPRSRQPTGANIRQCLVRNLHSPVRRFAPWFKSMAQCRGPSIRTLTGVTPISL